MTTIQPTLYASALRAAVDGALVWAASTSLTLTLHSSSYTPDLAAHTAVSNLTNELATGSGYTSGGVTLSSPTTTIVAANSWTATRANTTAYNAGQIVRPAVGNGYLYRCTTAGTTAGAPPSYPTTVGTTVTDGSVVWTCVGRAAVVLDAADLAPAWGSFSAGPFRHVVLSDRAAALATAQPLIAVYSYGSDQTGGGGAFNITFDAAGGVITLPIP